MVPEYKYIAEEWTENEELKRKSSVYSAKCNYAIASFEKGNFVSVGSNLMPGKWILQRLSLVWQINGD